MKNFTRIRLRQTVHVIENTSRPGSRMILKPKSNIGLCMVMLARLYDLRAIL